MTRPLALAALLACAPPLERPPVPDLGPQFDALERRILATREARYHVEVRAMCVYPERIPMMDVARLP